MEREGKAREEERNQYQEGAELLRSAIRKVLLGTRANILLREACLVLISTTHLWAFIKYLEKNQGTEFHVLTGI